MTETKTMELAADMTLKGIANLIEENKRLRDDLKGFERVPCRRCRGHGWYRHGGKTCVCALCHGHCFEPTGTEDP